MVIYMNDVIVINCNLLFREYCKNDKDETMIL